MMYPDTSNTTSSEDTEPSSEETYKTVKNSRGKNRDYQLMVEGFQLMEATQYITQLDSLKWTRADTRKTQEGEKKILHLIIYEKNIFDKDANGTKTIVLFRILFRVWKKVDPEKITSSE
ncbi:hypothetical protein BpHYR1_032047 [Brachionus plicatilis]|uniref:Uncharacterized protein n=1 Tax=Brachionus plicatilis TaxID=10195 RepID=A0A3M7S145_BRAPC|nr:hypothetical protein BpHYR1_032047 [Brachionus plicatilis]